MTDQTKCENDAKKFYNKKAGSKGCWKFAAKGCVYAPKTGYIFFNTCKKDTTAAHHTPVCEQKNLPGR